MPPAPLTLVARDDQSVQLQWRAGALSPGVHELAVAGQQFDLHVDGDRGGVVHVDGLAPGTGHDVLVDGRRQGRVATLTVPPGQEGAKVATISDCHIGNEVFGALGLLREPKGRRPFAERCLVAALAEIKAWGPDLLVIKGDLVEEGRPEEFETAARVLADARLDMPVVYVNGNHELKRGHVDRRPYVEPLGIRCPELATVDLPHLRVIAADTCDDREHGPVWPPARHRALIDALAGTPDRTGALVCMHHHFHTPVGFPVVTSWPPGYTGRTAASVVRDVARVHPATLLTAGHTHCNRWQRHGPVAMTQVGSPKDGLGVWGAYRAFEGGIIQSVRRIERPDCVEWIDRTLPAVARLWGRWSPGTLDQRCFAHRWLFPSADGPEAADEA